MKKIIGFIPINPHRWEHAKPDGHGGAQDKAWHNMYFWEAPFDFSILPKNTYGKLLVELKDDKWERKKELGKVGIRLAYQPRPGKWIPIEGSEVYTEGGHRWILAKSDWFKIPPESEWYEPFDGVVLLWIQGMQEEGSDCVIAMVNIVLAVEENE